MYNVYRIDDKDSDLIRIFHLRSFVGNIIKVRRKHEEIAGTECVIAEVNDRLFIVPKSLLIPISKQEEVLMEVTHNVPCGI